MNRGEGDMSTSRYTFGRADPCGIMSSVELMTTRRRLRDFELEDYQAVHAFATDLAVVSYVEWGPNTPMETQAFLREARAGADVSPRRRYALAVVVPSDAERLIGSIELRVVSCEHRRGEIGYVLRASRGGLVMQPRPPAACSPSVSTNCACTRFPLPVTPRIARQSRSWQRTACTGRGFLVTIFMPGASGETDSCPASSAERQRSRAP